MVRWTVECYKIPGPKSRQKKCYHNVISIIKCGHSIFISLQVKFAVVSSCWIILSQLWNTHSIPILNKNTINESTSMACSNVWL